MTSYWQENGHVVVHFKSGVKVFCKLEDYDKIVSEWESGKAFIELDAIYDFKQTIKLAEVICIMRCSPESLAWEAREEKEKEKEDNLL